MTADARPTCPKCGCKMSRTGAAQSGKARWMCRGGKRDGYCYSTTNPAAAERDQAGRAKDRAPLVFKQPMRGYQRYIITSAQNATPIHAEFFRALQVAAEHLGAALRVIPTRYKNPTSLWSKSQEGDEWWDPAVVPYLYNQRFRINKNLIVLADIKTQPTASDPLSGFEAITHSESGILGHTKLALKAIAAPSSKLPKILTTTGACTQPNYTDTKAGKLGEFHHTLGAVLVELEGSRFHLRQINAKRDGTFFGLDATGKRVARYTPQGVLLADGEGRPYRAAGIVFGDTHAGWVDPGVERATFGKGGMMDVLNPEVLVWNDLLDGYAVNHHHFGNPFNEIAKHRGDKKSIEAEVRNTCAYVAARTRADQRSVIVSSNHNDFLRRWIIQSNWKDDPINAQFYLATALKMVSATRMTDRGTEYPDPFALWAKDLLPPDRFQVLGGDESCTVRGIEVGMHGDRGPNGARGTLRNLRRIGIKSIIGHSHTPGISEGCYQTGTSTLLRLEYNGGPSSWMHAHAVIWPDGKRSLINVIDGHWKR